jgi:hypothetical protein
MTNVLEQFDVLELDLSKLSKKAIDNKIEELQRKLADQIDSFAGCPLVIMELKANILRLENVKKPTLKEKEEINMSELEIRKQEEQIQNAQRFVKFFEDMIAGFQKLRGKKGLFSK